MYSKFKSFSIMGVSNSEMFLSAEKDLNSLELNFLAKPRPRVPTLEFHQDHDCHNNIATSQDSELCEDKRVVDLHGKDEAKGEFKVEEEQEEDGDGFKTPKSLDQKIPVMLQCPPAPRKPKTRPLPKRKLPQQRRILHDLSNEIEALFPPALRADLGNKIKKVRQETHAN
ncbi:hypothetical protein Pint_32362 [Pistacia integerrima]|uniref:Uncharacterized protein n=1 Tax=Pistacia integerrima TaxID=434235 RepID=A0ACC0XMI9_9ROSI|nr:hypothetical protein Pint_32362 [Pistacia integerrima]